MKIYDMTVILPTAAGKKVMMKKFMTMDEIEEYRRQVTGAFEAYGFPGAIVSFTTGHDQSNINAGPAVKEVNPEPLDENRHDEIEPNPDTLPQYNRFSSIKNLFKK